MIDARYTYSCDECAETEAFDVESHATGWIQFAEAGERPRHFCSYQCLILNVFKTVAAPAPDDGLSDAQPGPFPDAGPVE